MLQLTSKEDNQKYFLKIYYVLSSEELLNLHTVGISKLQVISG